MNARYTMSVLLCAVLTPLAHGQSFLPAPELVMEALAQQAEVLAAEDRLAAAGAEARALAVGSYELEATLIPQRRRAANREELDEFEVELGRRFRLPGKAPLDREIGSRLNAIAHLERNEVVHDAAHRFLDLWMQWLRAAATDEEAKAQQQSLQLERESLARRVEVGDAAQLDLDLITAELAQARAMALRSEALVTAARQALDNDFPQIPLPARAPLLPNPEPLPGENSDWSRRIVDDSYAIKAHQEDAARQDAAAKRAHADRIPDPSVGVRFFNERDGEERAVGLVFTMPFGGRYRREIASAERANALALQRDAEVVRRTVTRDAQLKAALSADALAQWRAQRDAHEAMTVAAARTSRAWELGEIGLADRLLAARNAREMAYQELSARAAAHEAQLRVRIDSHDLWHAHGGE